MTAERRDQIMAHLRQIKCLEELDGFRRGLQAQGEMQDAEVFRAVWDKSEELR
jgi:hypothetical protein